MKTYSDVVEFRASEEAMTFTKGWLDAQRSGECDSDYHIDLLAWTADHPFHVLGIVINLIDQVGDDKETTEMIALGPVEWLCKHCGDEFVPVICEAIRKHPGLASFTKWNRENSSEPAWVRYQSRLNAPSRRWKSKRRR